jgi:hypothetical protein
MGAETTVITAAALATSVFNVTALVQVMRRSALGTMTPRSL